MTFSAWRQQQLRGVGRAACAAVVLWLVGAHPALAAQFYVSAGGSNGNAGTAAAPWATLQYAAGRVGPGDTVTVRPGDYTGFHLTASGGAGSPIRFLAEPGARITARNATTPDGINLEGASHVVIDGFEVFGMGRAGVRSVLGQAVTIRNVRAYDNERWGIFTGFVDDLLIENNETYGSRIEHGIYVSNSGDRPVLRGNTSYNNRGSGIHMNGDVSQGGDGIISGALVTGNRIFGNAAYNAQSATYGGGSGINMDGVQDSRIENNLLYDNHASGISLYSIDGAAGSSRNLVINNTIHQPAVSRWAVNIRDRSLDNAVRNNILVSNHPTRGAISVWQDSTAGFTSDYNVLIPRFTLDDGSSVIGLAAWRAATGNDLHSLAAGTQADLSSLFVDVAAADYRLKPGAVAIDAGSSLGAPSADLLGTPRPQGSAVDIGALEAPGQALAGDFDGNGRVDAADLAAWRMGFAAGTRTGGDFVVWQRQLGIGAGAGAVVAEPGGGGLGVVGGVVVGALSRKRRAKK